MPTPTKNIFSGAKTRRAPKITLPKITMPDEDWSDRGESNSLGTAWKADDQPMTHGRKIGGELLARSAWPKPRRA